MVRPGGPRQDDQAPPRGELWSRLAIEHGIGAYDVTYVAAAERTAAPHVSADIPLIERFRGKQPTVLSLSEAPAHHSPPAASP